VHCGRSVADSPDDPVIVEAAGEVAERLAAILDGQESVQPQQLLHQVADESLDAAIAFGLPHEGRARRDPHRLDLVLEGMRAELAPKVVAALRVLRDPFVVPPRREVDRIAGTLDGIESNAAPRTPRHSPVRWSTTRKTAVLPSSERHPVASMAHISSGVSVVIVRSCVSRPRTPIGRSQARMAS